MSNNQSLNLKKGGMIALIVSILVIFLSGIFFAGTYMIFEKIDLQLHDVNCEIQDNVYFSDCQDLLELSIYPFLGLRSILVWFSYAFIFALVIGLLVMGYKSGRSPALIGCLILSTLVFAYIGIEMSNIYRTMLENPIFFDMMTPFAIYNKIILNFHWFIGIIGLISSGISIVNYQKVKPNSSDMDY